MKIKHCLFGGLFGLAGVILAQIYSVNFVGYVNLTVPLTATNQDLVLNYINTELTNSLGSNGVVQLDYYLNESTNINESYKFSWTWDTNSIKTYYTITNVVRSNNIVAGDKVLLLIDGYLNNWANQTNLIPRPINVRIFQIDVIK